MATTVQHFIGHSHGKTAWFPYLVIAFLPLALLDLRLPLPRIEIRLSDFYLLSMVAYFVLCRRDALPWIVKTLYPFVPFLLYVLIYSALNRNVDGVLEFVQWCFVLCWLPILSYVLRDADDSTLNSLLYGLLFVTVFIAIMHILSGRLMGYKLMGDARYAFGLFSLVAALSLARYKSQRYWWIMLVALTLMVLSLERKGIVIFFATILVLTPFWALKANNTKISVFLVSVQILAFLSGFIVFYLLIQNDASVIYFLDEERALWESDLHRENLIANGVQIFLDHPWFGVGAKALRQHMSGYYLNTSLALYTHNFYLDFFVEYGLLGTLLFMGATITCILQLTTGHPRTWLFIAIAFYCFAVPIFMANGTTTMLIYITALSCCFACAPKGNANFVKRQNGN